MFTGQKKPKAPLSVSSFKEESKGSVLHTALRFEALVYSLLLYKDVKNFDS